MTEIGNTEALAKYLQLEKENKRLFAENQSYYDEIVKLRKQWSELAHDISTLFNWLETRENTQTKTIKRKMAETFKFAYMEAHFEDLKAKWKIKQ
jgi:predicted nuclease with TOPRIM domain